MKKKKTFESKTLSRITLAEHLLWLIPLFCIIQMAWKDRQVISETLAVDNSVRVVIAIIVFMAIAGVLESILPFVLLKILIHFARKQIIRNNTFQTVADFDYYRDKLTGLSPGTISLLADLKVEQRKDVAASIMKYQEMGILRMENNQYIAEDYGNAKLRESDKYLIEGLVHRTFHVETDTRWRKLVEQEAIADGYFTNRVGGRKKGCGGCLMAVLVPIILMVLACTMVLYVSDNMQEVEQMLETAPEDAMLGEQLEYLAEYPQCYPVLVEMVASVLLFFIALISPLMILAGVIGTALQIKWLRRTALGNEMAECVYGMKNFIHDFSNLSEADQDQLVLWDDYLIYAVVLEENQQIVDEITNRRKIK